MLFNRRNFIQSTLITAGATSLGIHAQQAWPERPVKFVVPFAAGGGADVATRMLADQLRVIWNSGTVIVDNKTGANSAIAVNNVLNSPRDGYTFLTTVGLTMQLPYLGQKVNFEPMTELIPVSLLTIEQLVLVVNTNSGIQNFAGLVSAMKANPKGISFGTFGAGSTPHLVAAQMANSLNQKIEPIHYRGAAPAVQALLSGEVQVARSNLGVVQQHVAAGKAKVIAVTGTKRYRFIPEVPTFAELAIPDLDMVTWIGVFAAKGTPPNIVRKLSADMQKALATPELVARFHGFYVEPGGYSLAEFQNLVKSDDELASQLIRTHQIRIE